MGDILTNTVVMLVGGIWGASGGIIYWAKPPIPKGWTQFAKRVGVGWVAGAAANVFGGISPFDATGAWDTASVGKLIAVGFMGLASLGVFLPEHLNEQISKLKLEQQARQPG